MTLRDYFAAQAIGPLLGSDGFEKGVMANNPGFNLLRDLPAFCADVAYQIADEMLKARLK